MAAGDAVGTHQGSKASQRFNRNFQFLPTETHERPCYHIDVVIIDIVINVLIRHFFLDRRLVRGILNLLQGRVRAC